MKANMPRYLSLSDLEDLARFAMEYAKKGETSWDEALQACMAASRAAADSFKHDLADFWDHQADLCTQEASLAPFRDRCRNPLGPQDGLKK
jgi:hypothetical protein